METISMNDYEKVISLAKVRAELIGLGKGKSEGQFLFSCPLCSGIVEVFISSLNGHTHGRCSTKTCVHWVE
jgi:hypothetical protein